MKVVFITPRSRFKTSADVPFVKRPSLGPVTLATILKSKGHEAEVYEEGVGKVNPNSLEADVFCISSLTSSAKRGYEIAGVLRQNNPDCKIVMGGVHPSTCPEEAGKHADHVVVGEADLVIDDVVKGNYGNQKIIPGVRTPNLDELPYTDFSLIKNLKHPVVHQLNTSRGCPFNCNFCCVTQIQGRRFRFRSPENIINEMKTFKNSLSITFKDGNFCADKNRAKQILKMMIKEDIHPRFLNTSTRLDIAGDPELIDLFTKASDYFYPLFGIESISDDALKYYRKGQTSKIIKKNIRILKDAGIKILGQFILGCDFDTKKSVEQTIEFINETEIDLPTFSILIPFPGTRLRQDFEAQNRILINNWDYYDGCHVTIKPKNFSPLELHHALIDSYSRVYSSRKLFKDLMRFNFQPAAINAGFNILKRSWHKQNKLYVEKLENEDYAF